MWRGTVQPAELQKGYEVSITIPGYECCADFTVISPKVDRRPHLGLAFGETLTERVILVTGEHADGGGGGIGTVARELSRELDHRGVPHQIVCSNQEVNDEYVDSLDVRGSALAKILDFGYQFRRYLRGQEDSIVHFHLPSAIGPLLLCPDEVFHRSIVTFHTTAAGFRRYLYKKAPFGQLSARGKAYKLGYARIQEGLERVALRRVGNARVTTVSTGVRDEVESLYRSKVDVVIQNGLTVNSTRTRDSGIVETRNDRDNPTDDHIPTVLTVGRLVPQKGYLDGIRALSEVEAEFSLTMVGTGSLEDKLRRATEQAGIATDFTGYVSDKRLERLYREADLLFMPSLYEGLPMVALEAAQYGLPIVATERARVGDVVCKENQEFLIENGAIGELALSLSTLIQTPSKRRRIGTANRAKATEGFTAERMSDHYCSLYEEVSDEALSCRS